MSNKAAFNTALAWPGRDKLTLARLAVGCHPPGLHPGRALQAPGGCRLLRIHADAYSAALRMGKAENLVGARAIRQVTTGFTSTRCGREKDRTDPVGNCKRAGMKAMGRPLLQEKTLLCILC